MLMLMLMLLMMMMLMMMMTTTMLMMMTTTTSTAALLARSWDRTSRRQGRSAGTAFALANGLAGPAGSRSAARHTTPTGAPAAAAPRPAAGTSRPSGSAFTES
eukprot:5132627-Pyramimonas_sp.AAC.1